MTDQDREKHQYLDDNKEIDKNIGPRTNSSSHAETSGPIKAKNENRMGTNRDFEDDLGLKDPITINEEKSEVDEKKDIQTPESELLPLQCPHSLAKKGKITCSLISVTVPHKQSNACQSILYRICLIYLQFGKNMIISKEKKQISFKESKRCPHLISSSMQRTKEDFSCNLTKQSIKFEIAMQFCQTNTHQYCFLLQQAF